MPRLLIDSRGPDAPRIFADDVGILDATRVEYSWVPGERPILIVERAHHPTLAGPVAGVIEAPGVVVTRNAGFRDESNPAGFRRDQDI